MLSFGDWCLAPGTLRDEDREAYRHSPGSFFLLTTRAGQRALCVNPEMPHSRALAALALAAGAHAFVPRVPRSTVATRGCGAQHLRARGIALRSMAEDADDFPSDSGLPEAEAPAPADEDVDATGGAAVAPAYDDAAAFDAETELLDRCVGVDRGASASAADRADVARLAAELEALAPPLDTSKLEGVWSLVYSSEPGLYRSSPFFWGFSRLLDGKASPAPVPGAKNADLAENVYAVTDALGPFYQIGDATQTISADYFVSEVELSIQPPGLPAVGRSIMTSSARATPTAAGLELELEKTEVRDSTLSQLPGLGFFADIAFPTKNAFDALSNLLSLTPDAATVQLLATYVSDAVRVTRTEGGALFVHERSF